MSLTSSQRGFIDWVEDQTGLKLFDLSEEEMETYDELQEKGMVDTDMSGNIYLKNVVEDPKMTENRQKSRNLGQFERVEARKEAADAIENIREYGREHKLIQDVLQNAETAWQYAEDADRIEQAVKLYRFVVGAEVLTEQLISRAKDLTDQFA